jgi:hypothetical protein
VATKGGLRKDEFLTKGVTPVVLGLAWLSTGLLISESNRVISLATDDLARPCYYNPNRNALFTITKSKLYKDTAHYTSGSVNQAIGRNMGL